MDGNVLLCVEVPVDLRSNGATLCITKHPLLNTGRPWGHQAPGSWNAIEKFLESAKPTGAQVKILATRRMRCKGQLQCLNKECPVVLASARSGRPQPYVETRPGETDCKECGCQLHHVPCDDVVLKVVMVHLSWEDLGMPTETEVIYATHTGSHTCYPVRKNTCGALTAAAKQLMKTDPTASFKQVSILLNSSWI